MTKSWHISRRTVLQGFGNRRRPAAAGCHGARDWPWPARKQGVPTRMAFLYVPNGKHMPDWTPAAEGDDWELPYIMEPLAPVKDRLLVLSGLAQHHARANGDGPGDHARALSAFLTGVSRARRMAPTFEAGVSVDQVAARQVGQRTKFPSLELGCDRGAQAGNCDSGYSCSYSTNISWRTETTPQAKEIDPKLAFERLFSAGQADAKNTARACSTPCWTTPAICETQARRRRPAEARRIPDVGARAGTADRGGGKPAQAAAARLSEARRHSRGLCPAHSPDVRHAGAGVSGRPDPRGDVRRGQRGKQSIVRVHRRARRASRPVAPRRRRSEADEDSRDQPLPRHAPGLFPGEAERHSAKASGRCWTTRWCSTAAASATATATITTICRSWWPVAAATRSRAAATCVREGNAAQQSVICRCSTAWNRR